MPLIVENLAWLAAAASMVAALVVLWFWQSRCSHRWRLACIALPGAAAVLIALALARPVILLEPPASRVVVLLDLSGSARRSPWQNPAWLRNLAGLRLPANTLLTIVAFDDSAGPRVLLDNLPVSTTADDRWPPAWPTAPAGASSNGTDIAAALEWRSPAEARGETKLAPRWIITDGLIHGAANLPGNSNLFAVAWTTTPPPDPDVGILELSASALPGNPGVEISARVAASAHITAPITAYITIFRDGNPIARQTLTFAHPGARWLSVRDLFAPPAAVQSHRYELTITRTPTPDPWPENDRASVLWLPQTQPPRILVVGGAQGAEPLAALHPGIIEPRQLPADLSTLLQDRWQVIILNDVPLAASPGDPASLETLPPQRASILDRFVRDTGGGLVILGRKHAFGPGHYLEAGSGPDTLEGLSPVSSQQTDRPPARIIFLLDASGSMNESAPGRPERKFQLAARGAESAMSLLLPQDQITLLSFSDHTEILAQGTQSNLLANPAAQDALRQRLDQVQPTGNTVPDSALADIRHAALPPLPDAGPTLIVLLTDGEIPAMDIPQWKTLLAQSKATLTIVAPLPHPGDTSTLRNLAQETAAIWLPTDDAGEWAALLKRAVARQLTGTVSSDTIRWRADGLQNAAGLPLTGNTRESIRVWEKPEAALVASGQPAGNGGERGGGGGETGSRRGDKWWPMAAEVQRGLGKVAAIAMGPGDDPADRQAYSELLRHVLASVMPPPGDRRFTLAARRDGASWIVTADGVEADKFLDGKPLELRLWAADSASSPQQTLAMTQTAPGHYETRVDHADSLAGIIVRRAGAAEELLGRIQTARVAGDEWPASFERNPVLAPAGTHSLSGDPSNADRWHPRILGMRLELAKLFWLGAAACALLALFLRRGPSARMK